MPLTNYVYFRLFKKELSCKDFTLNTMYYKPFLYLQTISWRPGLGEYPKTRLLFIFHRVKRIIRPFRYLGEEDLQKSRRGASKVSSGKFLSRKSTLASHLGKPYWLNPHTSLHVSDTLSFQSNYLLSMALRLSVKTMCLLIYQY